MCDCETGHAGRSEDSLYAGHMGPYCVDCWDQVPDILAETIGNQQEKIRRLSKKLAMNTVRAWCVKNDKGELLVGTVDKFKIAAEGWLDKFMDESDGYTLVPVEIREVKDE